MKSAYLNSSMSQERQFIPMQLDNGVTINVETTNLNLLPEVSTGGVGDVVVEDVSSNFQYLKQATDAIEGIAQTVKASINKVKPTKATVEFGLEFGYDAGKITALIVNGSGTANLKITLEWEEEKS